MENENGSNTGKIPTGLHKSVREIATSTRSNSQKILSLHHLVKQKSTDTKKLFKLVTVLTGNKDQNPLPEAKSDKGLAEKYAQFFLNNIEKNKRTIWDFTKQQHQQ